MTGPILVTGGLGFLGGWVVRGLLERGQAVRILDLPQADWPHLPEGVEAIRGDIRDRTLVARAVRGCRAVIHIAGLPQLWVQPRGRYRQVNFQGAVHVLEEATRAGCERIVHVSSATIHPSDGSTTCAWRDALGAYCQSKLRAERHALKLARGGAPIVIVSPTAPVGPGDYSATPPTQMLLDFCRGHRKEYLDTSLNLIDARDAAEGMIRAAQVGAPGTRYLLGNATVSLRELFCLLAAKAGVPEPNRRVPYGVALAAALISEWWSDVVSGKTPTATVAGVRLARRPPPPHADAEMKRLGVSPRPLAQTLDDTIAWFREAGWVKA